MDFFEQLDAFEKTFWYIAIPFSVFFILQTILTMFGFMGGGEADFDGDIDTDTDSGFSFQVLSLKNFIIFFTVFGWTGIVAYAEGASQGLSVILAIIAGIFVIFLFALITYFTYKLAESGNFKLIDAVGAIGAIYIPIKANRGGIGKIHITINGTMRELEAMTDHDEDLKTGMVIIVKEIFNNQILIVEPSKP